MNTIAVKNKIEERQPFKVSLMKQVIKPTVPHRHQGYHEVIFLSEGAGTHLIDDNEYQVTPPVAFIMRPGQIHCWEFSKIPKGFVCIFKESFLNEYPHILSQLQTMATKFKLHESALSLEKEFNLMREEYLQESPDSSVVASYLHIILTKINRLSIVQKSTVQHHPLIVQYRKLVEEHFVKERTVDFYAEKLGVTKRFLTRFCSKEIGSSAYSIINEQIVVESKRLLKHSTNSISEIGYQLGFHDPSHFVRFFKSKTNLTPKEFQSKIK